MILVKKGYRKATIGERPVYIFKIMKEDKEDEFMGKNNRLIENLATIAKRNREMNIDKAIRKQTPIFCAAMALALKRMAPDVDTNTIHDFLIEVQDVIDDHPKDIFKACREETGIIIKVDKEDEF